jgi:hypothetical protein
LALSCLLGGICLALASLVHRFARRCRDPDRQALAPDAGRSCQRACSASANAALGSASASAALGSAFAADASSGGARAYAPSAARPPGSCELGIGASAARPPGTRARAAEPSNKQSAALRALFRSCGDAARNAWWMVRSSATSGAVLTVVLVAGGPLPFGVLYFFVGVLPLVFAIVVEFAVATPVPRGSRQAHWREMAMIVARSAVIAALAVSGAYALNQQAHTATASLVSTTCDHAGGTPGGVPLLPTRASADIGGGGGLNSRGARCARADGARDHHYALRNASAAAHLPAGGGARERARPDVRRRSSGPLLSDSKIRSGAPPGAEKMDRVFVSCPVSLCLRI